MTTDASVPVIPKPFDDLLYRCLAKAVGSDRAFAAVDAVWVMLNTEGAQYLWRDGVTSGSYTLIVDLGRSDDVDSVCGASTENTP